jgi:citrate synthase
LLSKLYRSFAASPFTTRVVTSTLSPGDTFAEEISHAITGVSGSVV